MTKTFQPDDPGVTREQAAMNGIVRELEAAWQRQMRRRMALVFLLAGAALCVMILIAHAAEPVKSGAWSDAPQYERDWLSVQRAPSGMSCCGIGDAVEVEVTGEDTYGIAMKVTNPRGRFELQVGAVIHADPRSVVPVNLDPDGHAIAWVSVGGEHVYCLSRPWGV